MIEIDDLHKEYTLNADNNTVFKALKGISYKIETGTFFTMLGPSGCGKTTTLRSIAGLERPSKGQIRFKDQIVYSSARNLFVPPERRGLGMVFQSYAIWPHMTVAENVAYPLTNKKMTKAVLKNKVEEMLEKVGLGGYGDKLAPNLSGGQQQRVALARALVGEPEILLLDEPLSNLDAKLREQMRHELKHLQKQIGLTAVYVTHDQEEALAMSDVIALMYEGSIVEMGHPVDLYENPKRRFTASFIGISNFLPSVKHPRRSQEYVCVENEFGRFLGKDHSTAAHDHCDLSFRPHNVRLLREQTEDRLNTGKGIVTDLLFLGESIEFYLVAGNKKIRVRTHESSLPREGEEMYFTIAPDKCIVFDAEGQSSSNAHIREKELA
ncbi:ABC transporter ATP-binding protein [Brevibacillus centrosporus]|uniref:ABC transporter ATP-binding protein n=1 Tax=Brevibacillus centrosporus TaxID=54910 RepID=UPI002E1D6782|nr:ABC transporter ATP-binding protein [Brevibacillus centrosporus]